jgi:sugar/nucleoside kinase (ribokinase family)
VTVRRKLIGVGSALVDQLSYVPEAFVASIPGEKGGMELVHYHEMMELIASLDEPPSRVPGGSAANTVVGAAKLGLSTGLLTKVGCDEPGEYYRQTMASAGVDSAAFKVGDGLATGACLSLITPDSERTLRTYLGASATLTIAEVAAADFAGFEHAHVEGYLLFNEELLLHILKTARAAGCRISLDLAAPEVVRAALPVLPRILSEYVDVVLANEDEARAFSGEEDEYRALQTLAACCATAVVKLGKRGALVQHEEDVYEIPAYTVQAVDTTGAGDLWAAGFLYGTLLGGHPAKAADIGARVAAEVVKVTGAAIPEEIWIRLRKDSQNIMRSA